MGLLDGVNIDKIKKKAEEGLQAAQDSVHNFDAEAAIHGAVEGANNAAKTIGEGVQNFDAGAAAKNIANAAAAGADGIATALGRATGNEEPDDDADASREFIRILSFLAAADGDVSQEERGKIAGLAQEFSLDLTSDDSLIRECIDIVDADTPEFGRLSAAKINAEKSLAGIDATPQEKKTLCWNLFAVAGVDGISSDESDFIRFTCEKAGIDKAIIEELSNYNDAINELSAEKDRLQSSDRAYSEIEPLVTQITVREQAIIEAAMALVSDN